MVEKKSPRNTALDANALCQKCGLCCNGALFSHVQTDDAELDNVRKANIVVVEKKPGKFCFNQPCSQFSNGACQVYDLRPAKCHDYYCILQKKVLNGSVPMTEAAKIVSTVKAQASWILSRVKAPEGTDKRDVNLRDFLFFYFHKTMDAQKIGKVTQVDAVLARKIFEHVKLVDRFFIATNLLTKYGSLIQEIARSNPKPKKPRLRVSVVQTKQSDDTKNSV